MPTARPSSRVRWHTLFIAALTAGLLWLFFRNVAFAEVAQAFAEAKPGLIVAAVAVTLQTYLIRARRWQSLLAPIGSTRFRTAFRTTVIGFAVSFLIPRAGEVVRPYLLARQENLPASASFATIVVERLIDLVTVLLLFGVALPVVEVDVGPDLRSWGLLTAAVAVTVLAVLFVSAGHPERLGGWAGRDAWVRRSPTSCAPSSTAWPSCASRPGWPRHWSGPCRSGCRWRSASGSHLWPSI
jgi:uncharacterized membrane protein YbhN (UPF0104 family)